MNKDKIQVVVEATDGRALRAFKHEGKTFIESPENRDYQIRVKNKTDERVKIVPVVDSLNVITGEPGTDDPNETGYVLEPYQEQILRGFRVSDEEVAQFKFVKREKSYASERGEGRGNGVIAIRAYSDKAAVRDKRIKEMQKQIDELKNRPRDKEYVPVYPARPWYWEDWYDTRPYWRPAVWCGGYVKTSTTADVDLFGDSAFTCSARASDESTTEPRVLRAAALGDSVNASVVQSEVNPFDFGSAWGNAVKDVVKEVPFEAGALLEEVVVYYASIEGLKALGIDVTRTKSVAFPQPYKRGYCPPPSGWSK